MGRVKAERMVAISVILPKSRYLVLKQDADKQQVVVSDLVQNMIDEYLGLSNTTNEKVNQAYALGLLTEALSQKDAIAEAIQKAVTAYINSHLPAISS